MVIYKLGDKTFETTDYKYLPRDLKTLCEHTFVPETGLTGNVLIRFSGDGEGYILMTVTYTDVAE